MKRADDGEKEKFSVLMIDPPWPQYKGGKRKIRPHQQKLFAYPVLPLEEIFRLLDEQIFSVTEDTHVVFMWTIEKFLMACEQEMIQRGYRRHCRIIWDKGNGIAPAFTIRFSHEYLVWYYKGKLLPVCRQSQGKYTSVIREASREHSRKPDAAYKLVEQLYPGVSKIDVFSRQSRKGWQQFGNQCHFFDNT